MKVAVCAIAKNENLYIEEWVNWYKNLGFSKIYIFDNNDNDGEFIKDVVNNDDIVYIDESYRGKNDKFYQTTAYTKFYNQYKNDYEWILFCDIDEFLYLENHKTIQEFLSSNNKFQSFDAIALCWKIYDDNDLVYYDNRPVVEKFLRMSKNTSNNTQIKSLIKCKDKKISFCAHGGRNLKYCNALGEEIINLQFPRIGTTPIHKECWINHYRFKTIEEFILSKYKNFNQEHVKQKVGFENFFKNNDCTIEKLNVIKSYNLEYKQN